MYDCRSHTARQRLRSRHLRLVLGLLLGTAAACNGGDAGQETSGGAAVVVTDDIGREVRLRAPAQRVVSLLPSASETMVSLGAIDRLVGRTRYDLDSRLAHLPSVGGGLDPSLEVLTSLRPDLVIAFETAGGSPLRTRLEALGIAVFGMRSQDTTDIFRSIDRIGTLLGLNQAADSLAHDIRNRLAAVAANVPPGPRPTVVFLADLEPPIVAGAETFIMQLTGVAGGEPLSSLDRASGVWPQLSLEELVQQDPDLVLLPVRGDPALPVSRLRSRPGWREVPAVRDGRIAVIDADLASRPGPQIGALAEALRRALLPHLGTR